MTMRAQDIRQRDVRIYSILLALCLAVTALYWGAALRVTDDGVPLDDAWIYFQFARMGAQGHYSEFNAGEVVTGITGPLWALMLIPLHALAGERLGFFLALVKLTGIALLYASAVVMFRLARDLFDDRRAGIAAACMLLLMPKMVWGALSGMEVTLLTLLVLLALSLMLRAHQPGLTRDLLTPLVIGLAAQTRPEAGLLFVIFAAYQGLLWLKERRRSFWALVWALAKQSAVLLLTLSPTLLFTFLETGRPMANTFYAKTRGWNPAASLRFLWAGGGILLFDTPAAMTLKDLLSWPPASLGNGARLGYSLLRGLLTVGALIWGLRRAPRPLRALPALAWLVGDFLLYTLLFTRSNRHYFVPMLPPMALLAGGGLVGMARWWRGRQPLWPALGALLAFLSIGTADWAHEYAWNVKNINDQQVAIGRWVDANLPADALLAINDVGAIKYFSQRQIVDVTGLLSPHMLTAIQAGRKMEYLRQMKPDYLIVYDSWFPEASQWEGFALVREFQLDRNTIAGGGIVRVYKVNAFPPS